MCVKHVCGLHRMGRSGYHSPCVCLPFRFASLHTSLDEKRLLQTTSNGWPVPTKVGGPDKLHSELLSLGFAEL
jgi:hypothetical protein